MLLHSHCLPPIDQHDLICHFHLVNVCHSYSCHPLPLKPSRLSQHPLLLETSPSCQTQSLHSWSPPLLLKWFTLILEFLVSLPFKPPRTEDEVRSQLTVFLHIFLLHSALATLVSQYIFDIMFLLIHLPVSSIQNAAQAHEKYRIVVTKQEHTDC